MGLISLSPRSRDFEIVVDAFCFYIEEIREEIARAEGVTPSEVVLYRFTGWSRSEEYEREVV